MDSWIVTQVSFWFTVNKVKPAQIVDKCIELFVDMFTPGRGVGEGNWIQRGIRQIEQTSERTQREIDIRSSLRDWDNSFPEIHHELIVRWVAGAVVSLTVSSVYNSLKGALFGSSSSQYNNRGRRWRTNELINERMNRRSNTGYYCILSTRKKRKAPKRKETLLIRFRKKICGICNSACFHFTYRMILLSWKERWYVRSCNISLGHIITIYGSQSCDWPLDIHTYIYIYIEELNLQS